MKSFKEHCEEAVILSNLLCKQQYRACFFEHFTLRIKELVDNLSSNVDEQILHRLQVKLIEPIQFHLRISEKSTDKCVLIHSLIQVLEIIHIDDVEMFFHLYTLIFYQILPERKVNYPLSEELKMCVLKCGSCLINNCNNGVLSKIYGPSSAGKFSMGISISMQIAKEEKNIQLRIAALDFLLIATQYPSKSRYNEGINKSIGDLFMLYLPGVIAPLQEIILREETQHHLITVRALTCWGHILCVVMCDFSQDENLSESEIMKNWMEVKNEKDKVFDVSKSLMEKTRTKMWLRAAAVTLKPLICKIPEVLKNSNAKCRLELTRVMVLLLENCMENLKISLTPIVNVLVSSQGDEDKEVSKVATEGITRFEARCRLKSLDYFILIIEDNLYSLINKLPGIIHSGNEKLILALLKSFSGYVRILNRVNKLQNLISLPSTLRKLILVIKIGFELEMYPEIFVQDFSISDNDFNSQHWFKPWKQFRHFSENSIKLQLEDICHALGESNEVETILDYLLDLCGQERTNKTELLLILNEVVLSSKEIQDHVVDQLLDFYLDCENIYPPHTGIDENNVLSLKDAQSNVTKLSVVMEGIGKLAKNIGKRFENHLLRTLYYVLEKLESSFILIRDAAKLSAMEIANAVGLNGNISCLIRNNVDYLSYHLTVKLKRNNIGVFDVIMVLMKNCPFETVTNIEEIILSALKSSSQNKKSPYTLSYLRLFQTFMFCVNKWMKPSEGSAKPETYENETDLFVNVLKQLLDESISIEEETEECSAEVGEEKDFDEEMKISKPPRHISMTLSISNHCLNYLASKDRDKKLIVLEILNESVNILADRENELLPLVHKIWSPLVTRFDQTTDPLLINRSFTLLCTMSRTSKHFIRSRTLKEINRVFIGYIKVLLNTRSTLEIAYKFYRSKVQVQTMCNDKKKRNVLPMLQSFLTNSSSKSKLKDSNSSYRFTQSFKLQRDLLENLGELTVNLGLFERQTDLIVECALPYLSSFQPRELQEKSRELLERLKSYDPYLIWYKLRNLTENSEFSKNIQLILNSS